MQISRGPSLEFSPPEFLIFTPAENFRKQTCDLFQSNWVMTIEYTGGGMKVFWFSQ